MSKITMVQILSFGYKHGHPPQANQVFDVRFIKNPFYIDSLRPLTGADQPVADYILKQKRARLFLKIFRCLAEQSIQGYIEEGNNHQVLTIAFGCTGGRHRSVCMAIAAEAILRSILDKYSPDTVIVIEHRDLGRK